MAVTCHPVQKRKPPSYQYLLVGACFRGGPTTGGNGGMCCGYHTSETVVLLIWSCCPGPHGGISVHMAGKTCLGQDDSMMAAGLEWWGFRKSNWSYIVAMLLDANMQDGQTRAMCSGWDVWLVAFRPLPSRSILQLQYRAQRSVLDARDRKSWMALAGIDPTRLFVSA